MNELNSVKDTLLWKKLNGGFEGKPNAALAGQFAAALVGICEEAATRMKAMPSLHPEYTLHDEVHLLRVTELMAAIMPPQVLDLLNPLEIFLLITSAHLHDQGMVLDREEFDAMKMDPAFLLHMKNWEVDHPNLREAREKLGEVKLDGTEKVRCQEIVRELDNAMLSDFIRRGHGKRSSDYISKRYGTDKRFEALQVNLAGVVAELCDSHGQEADSTRRFPVDLEVKNLKVNQRYLALVLRLADLLDFDRERAPETIHRTIHFTNDVSVTEWEKHRAVQGWTIKPGNRVRFTMNCEHPVYQRAAYQFMDYIDRELAAAHGICDEFPSVQCGYYFNFLMPVDRSRIAPKDNKYIYHDLEFNLSRDELVKLLMTDKLYKKPNLAIREMLQNSLDALRHLKAVIKRDTGADWNEGKVEFTHDLNKDGYEILTCKDNGIGMDENIIEKFLTRVGRSYYRSPEFEQERETFRSMGIDYDPCSQFGIGFMSYFMLANRIIIYTRRYPRKNGQSRPLRVEINGYGGILVIKNGDERMPVGTSVELIIGKKPEYLDEEVDRVDLVKTLRKFAIACEFPVIGVCKVKEIEGDVSIPVRLPVLKTIMERADIKGCFTYSRDLSQVDPNLRGNVKQSFLIDKNNKLTLQTSEAKLVDNEFGNPLTLSVHGEETHYSVPYLLSIDGIFVGGRHEILDEGVGFGIRDRWQDFTRETAFIDITGRLKPELTASRFPNYRDMNSPRWKKIRNIVLSESAKIWEEVAIRTDKEKRWQFFWEFARLYHAPNEWMDAQIVWEHLRIPIRTKGKEPIAWEKMDSVQGTKFQEVIAKYQGRVGVEEIHFLLPSDEVEVYNENYVFPGREGLKIKLPSFYEIDSPLNRTIMAFSSITSKDSRMAFELMPPSKSIDKIKDGFIKRLPFADVHSLPFIPPLSNIHAIHIAGLDTIVLNNTFFKDMLLTLDDNNLEETIIGNYIKKLFFIFRILGHFSTSEFASSPLSNSAAKIYRLYKLIDWSKLSEMVPPYRFLANDNFCQITAEDIENWGKGNMTITDLEPPEGWKIPPK